MRDIEDTAREIVDAAIKIHRELGPGLLETAYQGCLVYELRKRGLRVEKEVPLPIHYGDQFIETAYRIDVLVDNQVIVENKSVEALLPIHKAQLLTYLRLKGLHLGFLLNWNVPLMKMGIKRIVYHLPEENKAITP